MLHLHMLHLKDNYHGDLHDSVTRYSTIVLALPGPINNKLKLFCKFTVFATIFACKDRFFHVHLARILC